MEAEDQPSEISPCCFETAMQVEVCLLAEDAMTVQVRRIIQCLTDAAQFGYSEGTGETHVYPDEGV